MLVPLAHRPHVADARRRDQQAHAGVSHAERPQPPELPRRRRGPGSRRRRPRRSPPFGPRLRAVQDLRGVGGEGLAEGVDPARLDLQARRRHDGRRSGSGARRTHPARPAGRSPGCCGPIRGRAPRRRARSGPTGRQWRSASREAAIPTTPGCQPSPASTSAGAEARSVGQLAAAPPPPRRPPRARHRAARGWPGRARRRSRAARSRVGGQHQLDPGVGAIEPPGGIDPRREPEGEVALVEARSGAIDGSLAQRPQPRPARPSGRRRARRGPARGSRPRSGTRSATVASATRSSSRSASLGSEQRGRELVGDAGRAELAERIAARARGWRIGQSGRRSPGSWWSVTITSMPGAVGGRDLVRAADPAVGRDQQAGAARGQALDSLAGQPVPVAAGDPGCTSRSPRPSSPQGPNQDRGRADAVAVVVAVDGDPPPGGDRLRSSPRRLAIDSNSNGSCVSAASRKARASSTVR